MTDKPDVPDPATLRPSAAGMREGVKIDASLDQLGTAMVRGGATRRESDD